MITCQLFARAVNGTLQYRGTVEDGGSTVWIGEWKSSRSKAMQDADNAARIHEKRMANGAASAKGKIGHIWRVERDVH